MTLDVVTLGPLNIDLLITGQAPLSWEQLTQWIGPSNVTVAAAGSNGYTTLALAKLGVNVGIVSVLADDALGDLLLHELRQAGVETSRVARQVGTLSGIGIYILLFGSKKRPLTYRMPTHDPWPRRFDDDLRAYLLSGRHLHCGGYLHFPNMWNGQLTEVFRAAQARGITTSLDPQAILMPFDGEWIDPLREMLRHTDLLMLDAMEAMQLTHRDDLSMAARLLHQTGPRVVAIKNGSDGTVVYAAGQVSRQAAVNVPEEEIVETVGAGDTFDAGLLAGFVAGWPLERCVKFASLAAASSLRGSGAVSSLASREELLRDMSENAGEIP
jgi:sugar/nucleoside kinase (ribokinase family)